MAFGGENNSAIPRPNAQLLSESLRSGQLNLATAIDQMNNFIRDTLKVLEEYAGEQIKLNSDRKNKVDKMDRLISDLSEKCQGMQQALLFKEEKYDEKCREVERYKVICELSAKAAVNDNPYYTHDENNNHLDNFESKKGIVKIEHSERGMPAPESSDFKRNVKAHTKFNENQVHLSKYVELRSDSPRSCRGSLYQEDEDDRRSLMAHYYAGGPSRRKLVSPSSNSNQVPDARLKERLEIIGGINVRGPGTNTGPVPTDQLHQTSCNRFVDSPNKRVKISLTGQTNEIMSSSGNVMQQMKQRFTERDLHKQVAGGCWTRMASRRKKEWPF